MTLRYLVSVNVSISETPDSEGRRFGAGGMLNFYKQIELEADRLSDLAPRVDAMIDAATASLDALKVPGQ